MSEPIKLYTEHGECVVTYSPKVTGELVAAGKLFSSPPDAIISSVDSETVKSMMDALLFTVDEEE